MLAPASTWRFLIDSMIEAACLIDGQEVPTSCSVGSSIYPQDGDDAETLMRRADEAMYEAKQSKR